MINRPLLEFDLSPYFLNLVCLRKHRAVNSGECHVLGVVKMLFIFERIQNCGEWVPVRVFTIM